MTNVLEYLDHTPFPERVAYTNGENGLTFAGVDRLSRAIGTSLLQAGHSRVPVVVLMGRSPDTAAAFFGAVRAGCAYVPVDPDMARNRIEGIFEDLQPAAVIYEEKTRALLESLDYKGDAFDYGNIVNTKTDDTALERVRREAIDTDLLYIVYTSGSTGQPKGVAACHRSVIDYIESLSGVLGFSEKTIFGSQTPLYVDACLKELYPTLKFGAATYLIPKELFMFPVKLIDYLNEHKINTVCWVVSALTILSGTGALEARPPKHLTTVAFGSEVFPQTQLSLWRKALPGARFFNLYGPTECTGMSCWYEVTRDFQPGEPIPIGQPFRNTRILLLDGEICVAGTSLTLGYYNDFTKTDASFVQNPLNTSYHELIYRTGDMGAYNEYGELVFAGRRDHQIKHMGHRIELGEIEAAVNALAGMAQAACVYDADKRKIVLFTVGTPSVTEIMAHCKERLPRFMVPNAVIPLAQLPLTPNGKTDRTALLATWRERG
ncbi:MAG: amino acid adenylation domain-containing protein [Oscillospiraceae bacterium]|nr:amino acid adenylation domain-containing protein [Oscillospiraceae bacterium]